MSKQKDVILLYKQLRRAGYGKDKTWLEIRFDMYNNLVTQTGVPRPSVRRIIGQYRERCGEC
jgi:hypothetical protein